jgi:hypothetical protein
MRLKHCCPTGVYGCNKNKEDYILIYKRAKSS